MEGISEKIGGKKEEKKNRGTGASPKNPRFLSIFAYFCLKTVQTSPPSL
jgi:hypothetical protein